jgi:Tfp pilus assembly protein PilE
MDMNIIKKILVILVVSFVIALPNLFYNFRNYGLKSREADSKLALESIKELQKKFHSIHGKYSYDLKILNYNQNNEVILGFSKKCSFKMDPEAQIIRSYQLSKEPQRWLSESNECNNRVIVQENKKVEKFIDEIFEQNIQCAEIQKGYEVTAIITSCGKYGVYRISEEGKIKTMKPIVQPFSYADYIKSFFSE